MEGSRSRAAASATDVRPHCESDDCLSHQLPAGATTTGDGGGPWKAEIGADEVVVELSDGDGGGGGARRGRGAPQLGGPPIGSDYRHRPRAAAAYHRPPPQPLGAAC